MTANQEDVVVGGSGGGGDSSSTGATRVRAGRGRERGGSGWSPSSSTTPAPSLQQGSGGGGGGDVDGGMGFMGNSSGDENFFHRRHATWDCIAEDALGQHVWHYPAFKMYLGLGNLTLLVYMWGVNIWVSEREIDQERHTQRKREGDRDRRRDSDSPCDRGREGK
ncbi:unnamed protein product [Ectocarpus sp. CCAP 1310/34]|nr:unnamed protein product [Ectocarpus sp. CCAP 1310/34]